jgi:hypothetical protein
MAEKDFQSLNPFDQEKQLKAKPQTRQEGLRRGSYQLLSDQVGGLDVNPANERWYRMKLAAILAVMLSIFCFAGEAVAQQSITVEFLGPWSLIHPNNRAQCGGTMDQCIVAISPSQHHKPGTFNGMQLSTGVYTLNLPGPQPDTFSGTPAHFLDGLAADKASYEKLIQATNPAQNRYTVILPFVPDSSIEQVEEEVVKITNSFVPPDASSTGKQDTFAKHVKIHYKVSNLSIALSGKLDANAPDFSKPASVVSSQFFVEPPDDADFSCDHHARQAFKDMIDLLQPKPPTFVDFPGDPQKPFDGNCRVDDPQNPNGGSASTFKLMDANTKKIDTSSLGKFVEDLKKSNQALSLNATGAKQKDIEGLLSRTQDFLQKDGPNTPDRAKNGQALVQKLNQAKTIVNKIPVNAKQEQRTLVGGLGILAEVAQLLNGGPSSANCKAPIMSLTIGP